MTGSDEILSENSTRIFRFASPIVVVAIIFAGCSNDAPETDDTTPETSSQSSAAPAASPARASASTTAPSAPVTAPPTTATAPPDTLITRPAIAAGVHHTCLNNGDGKVWCWGSNLHGQLGNGVTGQNAYSASPVEVSGITDAVAIDAGWEHSSAVHASGGISCWGDDTHGELGDGEKVEYMTTPVRVSGITDAVDVATGHWHTCALHATGAVSCWGSNHDGQLGNGEMGDHDADSAVPMPVRGIADAIAIDAGGEHSCAVHTSGEVSCWGDNWKGEIGNGRRGANHDSPIPVKALGFIDAIAVSTGTQHTCALHSTGKISCWGDNEFGQIGNGHSIRTSFEPLAAVPAEVIGISDATAVSVGEAFSCASRESGEISCWGNNSFGQLGSFEDGQLSSIPVAVLSIEDAALVDAGSYHACATSRSGEAYCWGDNLFGQLGNGREEIYAPKKVKVEGINDAADVAAAGIFTCALRETGEVSCWGRGWKGRAGDNATGGSAPLPIKVGEMSDATSISAGNSASCAIQESREILCWGSLLNNDFTENSAGEISPVPLPLPLRIPPDATGMTKVAVSAGYFCGLHDNGTITCAGANNYGQLGNGKFNPVFFDLTLEQVVDIGDAVDMSLGYDHSCAVHASGEVSCWGRNDHGQLGNGELNLSFNSTIPRQVEGLEDAVAVAVGVLATSCALHATGEISCWGQNDLGQLGTNSDLSKDHSSVPVKIAGIQGATAISAGFSHVCALLENGEVYCWGGDNLGELGTDERVDDGHSATPVKVSGISEAIAISAGSHHTCAVHQTGEITCWGSDISGQLGDGETFDDRISTLPVAVADARG